VSGKARTSIRQQLKQIEHEDAVSLGHRMLDRALEALGSSLERVPVQRVDALLGEHRYPRLEALLADIALGNRMPQQVAQALVREAAAKKPRKVVAETEPLPHSQDRILITGAERGVISFAQCCLPIPGDEIMGYHTTGKGIVVHRLDCPNVAEYRKSPDRWVAIGWDREVAGDFPTAMRIELDNRPGALAQVAAAIAEAGSNIDRLEYMERDTHVSAIRFQIEVRDRKHLAEVMRRVRRLKVVLGVQRI
jgi:guanosine-3',5'-bis(diphosphate) 3'-pyrophosphohydrolase